MSGGYTEVADSLSEGGRTDEVFAEQPLDVHKDVAQRAPVDLGKLELGVADDLPGQPRLHLVEQLGDFFGFRHVADVHVLLQQTRQAAQQLLQPRAQPMQRVDRRQPLVVYRVR